MNQKLVEQQSDYLRSLVFLLMIYISFVYVFTLSPFHFSKFYYHQYLLFSKGNLATLTGPISSLDIIINLLMLFPVGFLVASFLKSKQVSFKKCFMTTTALGFLISFTIEFSQVFLPRTTSMLDVFNNTLGASIGALVVYLRGSYDPKQFFDKIYWKVKKRFGWLIIFCSLTAATILLLPLFSNNFSNWDTTYPLQVGNEATMNRAWQGTIYKVSIFNRVLEKRDISAYFSTGYSQKSPTKISDGLLTEYVFEELPANNFGSMEEKLLLFAKKDSRINKLAKQNGVCIRGNSILQSKNSAKKLVQCLRKTNKLSIAIWMKPDNLKMMGPARIVSLSADPVNRNFTVGQSQDRINFRVRTPLTGNNGSKVSLTSSPILNSQMPQLVVATFYRGEAKLYYNGQIISSSVFDTSFYLPLLIWGKKKRYQIITFCFTLLFPLGWSAWGLASCKLWKRSLSILIVLIPFFLSSLIKILFYHHSIDVHLFLLSIVISFLVLVSGLFCESLILLLRKYNFF